VNMADVVLAAAFILLLTLCMLILAWVAADIARHVSRQRADSDEKARALYSRNGFPRSSLHDTSATDISR
jgi:hypothetical protein